MSFSHRDRRVHRTLERALALTAAAVLTLGAAASLVGSAWLGIVCVAGLAVVGGVYLAAGDRWVAEYEHDLRTVRAGHGSSGLLRAEVESEVGLDRPVGGPRRRSPHTRARPAVSAGSPPSPDSHPGPSV
jgi:hypothetical protein